MLEIEAIPALSDNYIWAVRLGDARRVAIVDPGEAAPAQAWLEAHDLEVGAYLITHHHPDHVGGLATLHAAYPATVYGPADEADQIEGLDVELADGDRLELDFLDTVFDVISVPGHTLGHIVFAAPGLLLAGDALFRAGCGKVFEGSKPQMQQSLAKLRALPESSRVCGGHEYTLKNLEFAAVVEPDNAAIAAVTREVETLRADGRPSLPSTLAEERETNPFLRWDQPSVKAAAERRAGRSLDDAGEIFTVLREWKDAL